MEIIALIFIAAAILIVMLFLLSIVLAARLLPKINQSNPKLAAAVKVLLASLVILPIAALVIQSYTASRSIDTNHFWGVFAGIMIAVFGALVLVLISAAFSTRSRGRNK